MNRYRNIVRFFGISLVTVMAFSCAAQTIIVSTADQLRTVIADLNSQPDAGAVEILLRDGVYDLTYGDPNYLLIERNNLTVRSQSGNRDSVIITGDEMSETGIVPVIFLILSHHFTVRDLTMQRVVTHCVQVGGEHDADYVTIKNCVIRNAYQQLVKISYNESTPGISGDYGLLEGCLLEYTAGIGPEWYIGGIDGHHANNWIVRNNLFRNIISPSEDVAEHAVHFWSDSLNTLVEQNLIINCDRGIGFGLGDRGHKGGIIRNNMIYHDANNPGGFADVGIGLERCPNAQVYNNTILLMHAYPNAIEYRFTQTTNVLMANNLVNKAIQSRDGGEAVLSANITDALVSWFKDLSAGNLHLAHAVDRVVNRGVNIIGLFNDYDNQPRPIGLANDIGADEWLESNYVKNDFDGDGRSDAGSYAAPDGHWYIVRSRDGLWQNWFGYAETFPISGDFDGDGLGDFGCYHPEDGEWYVYQSRGGFWRTHFGYAGTMPVTGDFDGDGRSDFGCYFPPAGAWYIYKSWSGFWTTQFGYEGTSPITGDFDGDGVTDFGCYFPPAGFWYVYQSQDGFWTTQFGYAGTTPVTGDFDGDGQDDFGCVDADSKIWYVYKSNEGFESIPFGASESIPVTGDFDGDGQVDLACYVPTNGQWFVRFATNDTITNFPGYANMKPLN